MGNNTCSTVSPCLRIGSRCCWRYVLLHSGWVRRDTKFVFVIAYQVRSIDFSQFSLQIWWFFFIVNRTPFDSSTIGGYVSITATHLIAGLTYVFVSRMMESLFLAMGLNLWAFHQHYESIFRNMGDVVDNGNRRSATDTAIQLKARLIDAILLHNKATEWDRRKFARLQLMKYKFFPFQYVRLMSEHNEWNFFVSNDVSTCIHVGCELLVWYGTITKIMRLPQNSRTD